MICGAGWAIMSGKMSFRCLIVCTALASAQGNTAFSQERIIKISSGAISGKQSDKSHVLSFKGIPFAEPPTGDLRWKPPVPVKPWKGVRNGSEFGASCVQRIHQEFLPWTPEFLTHNRISEDCLYLNIWTPTASAKANLPVIVFIHGGGFTEGAGDVAVYDGENLVASGLVMVTVNYRVGVFGFLAHPGLTAESEHHTSGDYGLLDQIAALRWVRDNIANFGGDPHRVTIWGQSAGAFSVSALIASPLTSGLFQRAVADSGIGVAGLPMTDLKAAEKSGVDFAAAHHVTSLKDLRAIPAEQLLPGAHENAPRFSPDIDGWVLPDSPAALSARGADQDVPVITGYQANDGLLFIPSIPNLAAFNQFTEKRYADFAPEFGRLYPVKKTEEIKQVVIESTRDRDRVSMFLWASRRTKNHRQPVFTYFFDRGIPWPQHPEFGAFHTGEIPYFFGNLDKLNRPWEQIDRDLSKAAESYLKNFAANGDPNGDGLADWKAVHSNVETTMEIGSRMGAMPLASKEQVDFWIRFFDSPAGVNAPPF